MMKLITMRICCLLAVWAPVLRLLLWPAPVHAQFIYVTNNGAITITQYNDSGGMPTNGIVVIPSVINNLPVTTIGSHAFYNTPALTNVVIPDSITNIGFDAFEYCVRLANVVIPNSVQSIGVAAFYNSGLTNVTLPNGLTILANGVFEYCFNLQSIAVPDTVTSIGNSAFLQCGLTRATLGRIVTNLGADVFNGCPHLTGVFFLGNAPTTNVNEFGGSPQAVVYYLPGTSGWDTNFAGAPALLWNPQMQTGDGSFGVGALGVGFNIVGTANIPIVLEACTSLGAPVWEPLLTTNLTGGSVFFADLGWASYPNRYYRLRSP